MHLVFAESLMRRNGQTLPGYEVLGAVIISAFAVVTTAKAEISEAVFGMLAVVDTVDHVAPAAIVPLTPESSSLAPVEVCARPETY